jgi:hypothetical protein
MVLAVVANTTRFLTRSGIYSWVEVALGGMVVAVARFAVVWLASFSRFPWKVVVERFALLTIQTNSIMLAHTSSMDHDVVDTIISGHTLSSFDWGTFVCVAVAETVSSNDHLVQGVVVFVFDVISGIQQVISQSVQLGKVDSEVGDFQKILDPWCIRVIDGNEWFKHSVDHLSTIRWFNRRITVVTDNVIDLYWWGLWDSRERSFAVVCKISVGVPSFAEVH